MDKNAFGALRTRREALAQLLVNRAQQLDVPLDFNYYPELLQWMNHRGIATDVSERSAY